MNNGNLSKLSSVATIQVKTILSPEARETLELARKNIKRISDMARGIHEFCVKVDPGREEVYEFSYAISVIISMLREDADLVAENVGEVLND